jgi:hypothetical protein
MDVFHLLVLDVILSPPSSMQEAVEERAGWWRKEVEREERETEAVPEGLFAEMVLCSDVAEIE